MGLSHGLIISIFYLYMKAIRIHSIVSSIGIVLVAVAIFVVLPLILQAQTISVSGGSSASVGTGYICPADAMMCPDGSWTSRSGPNCQFVCPGTTSPSPSPVLKTSPSSGVAPLTVSFSYSLESSISNSNAYRIDFGDGTTSGTLDVGCGIVGPTQMGCPRSLVASHTYRAVGTYTAELIYDMCGNSGGVTQCMTPVQIVSSATVVVRASSGGGDVAGFSASPRSGSAPLAVTFSLTSTDPSVYTVDFGDTSINSLRDTRAQFEVCAESYPYHCSLSHTYRMAGTYTATLIKYACPPGALCIRAEEVISKVVITVQKSVGGGGGNGILSVTPVKGPAPLMATFSAALTDTQYYGLTFGDGATGGFTTCSKSYPQRCSISHTYHTAGTYTAQLVYDRCPVSMTSVRCMMPTQIVDTVTVVVTADGVVIAPPLGDGVVVDVGGGVGNGDGGVPRDSWFVSFFRHIFFFWR